MVRTSKKKSLASAVKIFLLLLVAAGSIIPFLWMVSISLKKRVDVINPAKIFFSPTVQNYINVIQQDRIFDYFKNSVVVAVGTTVISLIIGTLAAYGFARFYWKKREDNAFWVLSQRMLPAMATVIPYFLMASFAGVLDTRLVLIIGYMTFNIPFTIWMMRGFIEDIPAEIEEAAKVDGCSSFQSMIKVVFPLVLPGLTATAIFCVINSWNEFVFANFLTSINAKTMPTSVMLFLSVSGTKWGEMAATGVISALPVLIFAMIVQKYMIRGLTFGAVKG